MISQRCSAVAELLVQVRQIFENYEFLRLLQSILTQSVLRTIDCVADSVYVVDKRCDVEESGEHGIAIAGICWYVRNGLESLVWLEGISVKDFQRDHSFLNPWYPLKGLSLSVLVGCWQVVVGGFRIGDSNRVHFLLRARHDG